MARGFWSLTHTHTYIYIYQPLYKHSWLSLLSVLERLWSFISPCLLMSGQITTELLRKINKTSTSMNIQNIKSEQHVPNKLGKHWDVKILNSSLQPLNGWVMLNLPWGSSRLGSSFAGLAGQLSKAAHCLGNPTISMVEFLESIINGRLIRDSWDIMGINFGT